ncbi:MAG TPA: efflux RND transporter permease subunit [Candidatus Eisenbacteria bacterium]|nr:efflux RND transporter permease subunit [Candidatus Eisenbacteria bacterium]
MKLSEVSIQRPVLATVMSLALLLFGVIAFTFLPVREYPDIDSPIVSVSTFYRGASAQVMETEITEVLEEQISTIEGVKLITSSSEEQTSTITVEFNLNRNVDQAANDVRDRVSRVRGQLPTAVDEPVVAKQDVNAQPIIWLALDGTRYSTLELADLAHNVLKEKLQRLNGVGAVVIGGDREWAMRVWLDPRRMAAYQLTVSDIENALATQNADIPSGRIEGEGREFSVDTHGDLAQPDEFAKIVVAERNGAPVHLSDVADVRVGAQDERSVARYDGVPAVGLGIVKQQKASTVEVADAVSKALPALRADLPAGMKLEMAYDSSTFIRDSIREVVLSLLIAIGLVFLVIFLFLRSLRATLIPAVAIPVSIVGTFTATYFLGFSLNILTLLALVLAIGLVVDDAIVMLENVHRHIEMGKPRFKAAVDGASEIGFAIVATTLTLVAVFVPVAFLTGRIGRLFNEFGIAVAVSVLLSGFVALTLTPMLCSRVLRPHHGGPPKESRALGFYDRLLRGAIRRRGMVVAVALVLVGAIALFFRALPSELVPTEDRGLIFNLVLSPEGATLDYTDKYLKRVEALYAPLPETAARFAAIGLGGGVTDGFLFVRLKPSNERHRSQQQIVQSVFPAAMSIPGVLAIPINPPSLGGGFGQPVQFVLQADSYDGLQKAIGPFMAGAQKLGYLLNMDSDLKLDKPQLEVEIDRDRAAQLGVSPTDIGNTLQTLLGGSQVTRFRRGNHQYDVMLQVPKSDRAIPEVIQDLYVRGARGPVQLASVVHVNEQVAARSLNHFNRERSATISANLAPGVTIGQALNDLRQVARRTLPPGVRTDLAGESREYVESSGGLWFLFGVALLFIYLVLAAQFESFIHPLTILVSVPLAVFGALLTLFLLHMSINIYSQIGLIMLIGLVTKNAILIVEYANQRRARGEPVAEAVVSAAKIRVRPILMTTLATVFGVMPIALGLGAGAESRKPLGMAVVGGMVFSTALTLLVVPVVYTMLARFAGAPRTAPAPAPAPVEPRQLIAGTPEPVG